MPLLFLLLILPFAGLLALIASTQVHAQASAAADYTNDQLRAAFMAQWIGTSNYITQQARAYKERGRENDPTLQQMWQIYHNDYEWYMNEYLKRLKGDAVVCTVPSLKATAIKCKNTRQTDWVIAEQHPDTPGISLLSISRSSDELPGKIDREKRVLYLSTGSVWKPAK